MITGNKSSLMPNEDIIISASMSGFTNGEKVYLKGAFYKEGSTNYFGFTKSNDSWIKNSATSLFQREVMVGVWDNQLFVKPDYEDTGFAGAGDYKFKLGFYYLSSSGNVSSVNWSSNDFNVLLFAPSPTPEEEEEEESESSTTKSSSSKSPTPSKSLSSSTAPSKSMGTFAKIAQRVKTASEYAKIKPITKEEKEKKTEVLGAREERSSSLIFLIGIGLVIIALAIFTRQVLKDREII